MKDGEIVLSDGAGNSAVVAPASGGWLLRYVRQTRRFGPVDVLHVAPAGAAGPPDLLAGSHVMFPIAGYSRSGAKADHYRWQEIERPLPIHGFAHRRPWRVDDVTAVSVRLVLEPDAATRDVYPFGFRLGLSYALENGALRSDLEIENRGDRPMPFSTGFHPYVRLPLTDAGRRAHCLVRLPAGREYVARPDGVVASPPDRAARVLAASAPAAPARHFADLQRLQAELVDEDSGLRVALDAHLDSPFRCLTAWSPRTDAPFYCVEPRTALQDAFSYATQGQLTILEPGRAFAARLSLDLHEAAD